MPGVGSGALELIPTVGNSYFAVGISGGSTTLLHVKNTGLYTVDGLQSSPSYSFNNDPDTGMFRPTTNILAFSTGGTERVRIDASGNVTATGNITAYSDERLKSDIETLDGTKTYEMRGVSYTRDGRPGSGVIAQELEEVAPELVLTNDEGIKSVDYGRMVGYLIETIKDLKNEVEELKDGIAKLRK